MDSFNELWQVVSDYLRQTNSESIYNVWFSELEPISFDGSRAVLMTTAEFKRRILAQKFGGTLHSAFLNALGLDVDVEFIAPGEGYSQSDSSGSAAGSSEIDGSTRASNYFENTFDTFVVGASNKFAHAAAQAVAANPGKAYNPLFIYGPSGLGKTHLMHAVGRKILEDNPNTNLLCISANRFINEVVSLSAGGRYSDEKIQKFDNKYRNLDALLIDDVQFLCKRGGTQQRLFNIFEALLPKNKQIILTCDTYARQLSDFDERLISRFGAGLSVSIEPAEFELRAAILLQKAKQQGVKLPLEVAYLIATRLNTNIRELEGALNSVIMRAEVFKKPITEELAKEALQGITGTGRISIENIQQSTAEHFSIKIADMHSKRRVANVAYARQIAMYLAKELTQKSLIEIGYAFGGRDHATVLYAVKKITKERAQNQELNHTLHLIEQDLKNWN